MGKSGDKKAAENGLTQTGDKVAAAAAQTPQEQQQYQGSFDIGSLLKQIFEGQMGIGNLPQGYQDPTQQYFGQSGELGKTLYDQTLNEAKDPNAYFESNFQPQLKAAEDYINTSMQRRGLLNSGLTIEQMGRAGVDLAIKESQARMDARSNALSRAAGLTEYIGGQSNNNLAALSNMYGMQQQFGQNSMGRQAQGAAQAGQYYAYPYQAKLGDVYGQKAAMYALPGQIIGAAGQAIGAMNTGGGGSK